MKIYILMLLPLLLSACCKNDDINNYPYIITNPNSELFETIQLMNADQKGITDISFYDDNNGVICGAFGFLAKTTDGGKTWIQLNVGSNSSFLTTFMLDINTFYTARLGLYKTSNAGTTFNEIGNFSSSSSSVFNIYFRNNSIGFVSHNGAIKKSIDGGNTWIEKYSTNSAYGIYDLKFTSQNVGYASGGAKNDYFDEGQIVKTINGGETWDKMLTTTNINSISFINDNIGYYSNGNKEIFKTTNGGVSWNKISTLDYYPTDILFQSNEIGYIATMEGKILITNDGGDSWKIAYDKTTVPINKITKTSKHIFAVGNNGLLIKSK